MKDFLLFLLLCVSWGSTWVAIKVGVSAAPPLFFSGSRFFGAGLIILTFLACKEGRNTIKIPSEDIKALCLMSLLMIAVCFSLIFWGEQYVSAGVTAIIVQGCIPIFLPFFSTLMAGEKLSPSRIISIILGLIGIGLLFVEGIQTVFSENLLSVAGIVAIILGTLSYCYGSVLGRPLLTKNLPIVIAGWQNILGGIFILGASLIFELPTIQAEKFLSLLKPDIFLAWLWLVFVGSIIGFVLYIILLKSWGPIKVSPYAFLTPIIAVALDYYILHKQIQSMELWGMLVIFLAMIFAFSTTLFPKATSNNPLPKKQ
ncbi:DMT family transporter [Entomobacter blattae]|uniref:Putative inner membrane transporter YedA n=1 Tax=Entomobacter blattae TaxID=2762277 RepID=A0A7H1NS70_9PROT|nr:EamA family transporter [Entomobacter blattae]QNT78630.1 putative inner membrane transporter YedA [Entomobacter blattae]